MEKLLTIQSLPEFLELQEMQLKESFDALDHDNDGILEIEELIRIIGIWEKNMSENEVRISFLRIFLIPSLTRLYGLPLFF